MIGAPEFFQARVLVTGGAGFIGSHLTDALVESGAKVTVLDNLATGNLKNLAGVKSQIDFIEGDIRDLAVCQRAAAAASYVFHQAAIGSVPRSLKDPALSLSVNVGGTANVFTAARDAGVKRVVYASSSSVYGDNKDLPKREGNEGLSLSPYATSKKINEELADIYSRCYGMQFVGLRYFNVYGPRQDPAGPYAAVIPRFFAAYARGEAPVIFGDGEQSRDFTFVKDVVMANLLAAKGPDNSCGAFNIGAGGRITINDLARAIAESVGSRVPVVHQQDRPGDVKHSMADASRAEKAFGFRASTALHEGIAQTKR